MSARTVIPSDLEIARTAETAADIPIIGRQTPTSAIRLLRTRPVNAAYLRRNGARQLRDGWIAHRVEDFPFERLEHFLPRYARRWLIPEIVDLIPSTSWFSSLANLLSRTSWEVLRAPLVAHHGGCEDCGSRSFLEAHEMWDFDDEIGLQSLRGIVVLCRTCHETRHLGLARVKGRFEAAFDRLCAINRVRPDERRIYLGAIEHLWRGRSELDWALDLRLPPGMRLQVRRSVSHAGDGWLIGMGSGGEVAVRVVDVGVEEDRNGCVTLVGLTASQLEEAHVEADAGEASEDGEDLPDDEVVVDYGNSDGKDFVSIDPEPEDAQEMEEDGLPWD